MDRNPQAPPGPCIVFAAPPGDGIGEEVRARAGVEVVEHPHLTGRALRDAAIGARIFVTRSSQRVDRALLEGAAGSLRAVVQASSGVDNIDERAAAELGIAVIPVDPGNAIAVAELTVMAMLALLRDIRGHWRATREGAWPDRERLEDRELAGKSVGIVGLGRVGTRVARRVAAFEARVVAYDPYVDEARFESAGAQRVPTLEGLLRGLDILTLHCPLTDETERMIDAERLSLLPPGALLVNTARGGVVDEAALTAALDCRRLGGAALDVFAVEPAPADGLAGHPRVLATPHLAGHTAESHARRRGALVDALVELSRLLGDGGEATRGAP